MALAEVQGAGPDQAVAVVEARKCPRSQCAWDPGCLKRFYRPQPTMDKPKREAILDLSKYVNERIRVKFTGGREGAQSPQS